MSGVSIIIPTLNEAATIERTLRHLKLLSPAAQEIIVVDGGSRDETLEIVKEFGINPIICDRAGRAVQMNRGAEMASGDILCFLHADTLIPDDAIAVIQDTLAKSNVACGGFISLMGSRQTTRWGFSLHNYLKTYYTPLLFRPHLFFRGLRILFGDQVMFCRRSDFWDCGGFNAEMPILEDADLCLKLFSKGKIRQVNRVVQSSDRRVAKLGVIKANAIYFYIGYLWGVGVSATDLKKFYDDIR
jgi:rSAM/selenodomain-associated transferase 2